MWFLQKKCNNGDDVWDSAQFASRKRKGEQWLHTRHTYHFNHHIDSRTCNNHITGKQGKIIVIAVFRLQTYREKLGRELGSLYHASKGCDSHFRWPNSKLFSHWFFVLWILLTTKTKNSHFTDREPYFCNRRDSPLSCS